MEQIGNADPLNVIFFEAARNWHCMCAPIVFYAYATWRCWQKHYVFVCPYAAFIRLFVLSSVRSSGQIWLP